MKQLTFLEQAAIEQLHKELSLLDKKNDVCNYDCISWRQNYGVFKNLPFHEKSDIYYFECSDNDHLKTKLLFTPDITIFHKGEAKILIYISELSVNEYNEIMLFYAGNYVEIYEADDYFIMFRTEKSENTTLKMINCVEDLTIYSTK